MTPITVCTLLVALSGQTLALPTRMLNDATTVINGAATDPIKVETNDSKVEVRPYIAAAVRTNCSLTAEDSAAITSQIKDALNDGAKMIKYYLNINNQDGLLYNLSESESNLYRPFFWVRARDRKGTGLLHLRQEYDVLSLSTLELDVESMNVNLTENPRNCLRSLPYTEVEILIRELVMNDFEDTNTDKHLAVVDTTDSVCNMHIIDSNGVADFRYYCCHKNTSREDFNEIVCSYLEPDTWLGLLLNLIFILKVLVVLFSPNLIPKSYYNLNIGTRYFYRMRSGKHLKIKALMTCNPERYPDVKNKFKLSAFKTMKSFRPVLNDMYRTKDTPRVLTLNHVQLRIKHGYLLAENSRPVGLIKTMFQSIVKCNIRKEPTLNACCNKNALLCLTWYTLLKRFIAGLFLLVLTVPWIIRSYFFFQYENEEIQMRKYVATEKSLDLAWPGNFVLLLTPLHALFIVIYAILVLEACIFGVMIKKMKEQFRFVLRKCFHDMHHANITGLFSKTIKLFIHPCYAFGAIGLLIGLITWPIYLIGFILILPFYLLPTLNITMQLLIYFAHFLVYLLPKKYCSQFKCFTRASKLLDMIEKNMVMKYFENVDKLDAPADKSKWKILRQLVVILMCLVSLYSIVFLTMEFVSFFIEMLVYTLIGLILNADTTLTYVSLTVLLTVYAHECFDSVNKKYSNYNTTINETIFELGKEEIENNRKQTNIALRLEPGPNDAEVDPVKLTTNEDGVPGWQMSRLLLFLGKNAQPSIPKTFFFKSCNIPFYTVPKGLFANYMKAATEFGKIILFLMFVLVVVLAFGNAYEISATNKMLVAVAGGMLPFLLQNFVFKSHAIQTVDKDNDHFQLCLENLIEEYEETWPVYDIDIGQIPSDITANNSKNCAVSVNGSQPNGSVVSPSDTSTILQSDTSTVSQSDSSALSQPDTTIVLQPESIAAQSFGSSTSSPVPQLGANTTHMGAGETAPLLNGGGQHLPGTVSDSDIDLLIYVKDKIDKEDFPEMK